MNIDWGLDSSVSILNFLIRISILSSCNRMPLFLRTIHKIKCTEKEGREAVALG